MSFCSALPWHTSYSAENCRNSDSSHLGRAPSTTTTALASSAVAVASKTHDALFIFHPTNDAMSSSSISRSGPLRSHHRHSRRKLWSVKIAAFRTVSSRASERGPLRPSVLILLLNSFHSRSAVHPSSVRRRLGAPHKSPSFANRRTDQGRLQSPRLRPSSSRSTNP